MIKPILKHNIIKTEDLNTKYKFHYMFNPHFEIEWVPIIEDRKKTVKWFKQNYSEVLNEPIGNNNSFKLNNIENWKEEAWGKWAALRLVILRDCISIDYNRNNFTTFNQFVYNAGLKMGEKYSNNPNKEDVYKYLKEDTNIFDYVQSAKDNFKAVDYYRNNPKLGDEIIYSYLKLAYFGFLKEAYTKLIICSHPDAIQRKFDVYQTDEKGDFQNMDFFIYIPRQQQKGLQGIWKTIGVGSKAAKNETHQKVHFMIRHYKDSSNVDESQKKSESLLGGLHLLKEHELDKLIEDNILNL
ncbi:hypothetical protein [Lysinibacillus tabacifolii]|uniref:DUF1524 domain-containing protein n=1 Tax=Lysinibacillus tabacifolii TaxID=1173107 RepID=A0ABY2SVF0_9BACI|nr:hypothetical protein [Lysinibacillus tabacifolii]TKI46252.1 hypothetical protein FC748_18170 [Lysinibacillus tabacifolii]